MGTVFDVRSARGRVTRHALCRRRGKVVGGIRGDRPNRVLLRQMSTSRESPAVRFSPIEEDCSNDAALAAVLQMEEESEISSCTPLGTTAIGDIRSEW